MQHLNNEMQDDLTEWIAPLHALSGPVGPRDASSLRADPTNKNELFGSPILVGLLEMPSDRMPE
jgi:hypothetical protein